MSADVLPFPRRRVRAVTTVSLADDSYLVTEVVVAFAVPVTHRQAAEYLATVMDDFPTHALPEED